MSNKDKITNVAHSVSVRLKHYSKEHSENFNFILQRYVMERFIYRLSISKYSDKYILKGASLFFIWKGRNYRITRDSDFLGYGSPDLDNLRNIFQQITSLIPPQDDGVIFDSDNLKITRLKEGADYEGARIVIPANIGPAKIRIQIDIGFGDAVVPDPEVVNYPTLLEFPAPKLRVYSVYTVISEKFHALATIGMLNSRMKDIHDLCLISRFFNLDFELLRQAIRETFIKRKTSFPEKKPMVFDSVFYDDKDKNVQWRAFIRKSKPVETFTTLKSALDEVFYFLEIPMASLSNDNFEKMKWYPGKGWLLEIPEK